MVPYMFVQLIYICTRIDRLVKTRLFTLRKKKVGKQTSWPSETSELPFLEARIVGVMSKISIRLKPILHSVEKLELKVSLPLHNRSFGASWLLTL